MMSTTRILQKRLISSTPKLLNRIEEPISTEPTAPLGPFIPKAAAGRLPEIKGLSPGEMNMSYHPQYRKGPQELMWKIDLENRFRYFPERNDLFFGLSYYANRDNPTIKPGCILLVDQITSRVNPQVKYFAGVLLGVRKKGLMTNIVLRGMVMGTGVEMVFPVYSPMISKFTVLREPPPELVGMPGCYWIRDKPRESGIDFGAIEFMVMKHKNQIIRARQVAEEKRESVKGKMEEMRKMKAVKAAKALKRIEQRKPVGK